MNLNYLFGFSALSLGWEKLCREMLTLSLDVLTFVLVGSGCSEFIIWDGLLPSLELDELSSSTLVSLLLFFPSPFLDLCIFGLILLGHTLSLDIACFFDFCVLSST